MGTAILTIDLDALAANWRALDRLTGTRVQTAAVVKADAYGLGAAPVAKALAKAGATAFFVALTEEGAGLRDALGPKPSIYVFSGHMDGDAPLIKHNRLIPLLNSKEQVHRHFSRLPDTPYGFQLDTGMNRLGMEQADFLPLRNMALQSEPVLIMSHLACADAPDDRQNPAQLAAFIDMTKTLAAPLSLSATGGILLGLDYHFDMTRPGIGLYGGLPFADAQPVVSLSLPVIQTRPVATGETVGYGGTWVAKRPSRIATVASGYADGLIRAMGGRGKLWAGENPCPLVGRVSMDLMGVDVSDLDAVPESLDILGAHQSIDQLADAAGTIGYEILTSLGARYKRVYEGG